MIQKKAVKASISIYLGLMILFFCTAADAFSITGLSASNYNSNTTTMNSNLGIDGSYTIENFEDSSFQAGLTISYQYATLPGGGHEIFSSSTQSWDGSFALRVFGGNYPNSNGGPTFSFSQGIVSFGLGFSNIDTTNWYIQVNGSQIITNNMVGTTNFVSGTVRNGYLFINAQGSEVINTVFIQRSSGNGDAIYLDHLAFKTAPPPSNPVPESATLLLFCLGALGIIGYRAQSIF